MTKYRDILLVKDNPDDATLTLRADERTRLLRVVILTSSNEETDIARGYSLCASSYIRKPVDLDRFVEVAGQLGVYWLLLHEPPPQPATNPA